MKYQQSSRGKKVRAALIGCGRMGAFTSQSVKDFAPSCWFPLSHIEALKSFNDIEISAVCDVNWTTLEQVESTYNVKNLYTDPKTMLESNEIDLLCIATRTQGRADLIKLAFENGIRAFHVEKPICNSVEELNSLSKIFLRDDIYVTFGTIRRLLKPYMFAKQLVDSGKIGKLRSIFIDHGEGMLFWAHPHSVDLCLYFSNGLNHKNVSASFTEICFDPELNKVKNDPILNGALVLFEKSVTAHIGCAAGMNTRLVGSDGEIEIQRDGNNVTLRKYHDKNPYKFLETSFDTFKPEKRNGTSSAIELLLGCIYGNLHSKRLNDSIRKDILRGQRIIFELARSGMANAGILANTNSKDDFAVLGEFSGKFA